MIGMASKEARKQANKQKGKHARKQTKGGVREGQMQDWIGCPQLDYVELWTTHQQARLMHGHVSKPVKMHIKPTDGTNKHGKHIIAQSGKGGKVCTKQPDIQRRIPSGYTQTRPHVRCNHTTTNLLRASSVAKPRTRKAYTSIKHRSKQAQTHKQG